MVRLISLDTGFYDRDRKIILMNGRVLIIAGSDSGGGAGIQGDIKTVSALGGYAMTAITAITVQDTLKVHDVHAIPPYIVEAQMRVALEDLGADAIKTGMLLDAHTIENVVCVLNERAKHIPCIVDPVMIAKSGNALLQKEALQALREKLVPIATLITPNLPEAEALLGEAINHVEAMKTAAVKLGLLGAEAVLLKGGHLEGGFVTDMLWDGANLHSWTDERIATNQTHGTGCTLASAIATHLAQGINIVEAISLARQYVRGAIQHAPHFGHGNGPLNHSWMLK